MRVLLLKDVKGLGHAGDVKEVAGGYALNYLLPNRLATPVSEGVVSQARHVQDVAARKQDRKDNEARSLVDALEGREVIFKARSGEGDRLYGSITSADIADALSRAIGKEVDRRYIVLDHPIKTLGKHRVTVKVGAGLAATVTAIVERES